ncbi:hypothetical protein ACHAXR_009872 [Thalassiosira sp. AJA248-18]
MASLQPLRNYLRQNVAHLRSSPCLLISSAPPPALSTAVAGTKTPSSISSDEQQQKAHRDQLKFQQQQNDPRVHSFVERNTQSLTLEFNLRTVPCTISSAFPTLDNVKEAVSLAKRAGLKEGGLGSSSSGDGVVIGVGSGAAMDLAKAVADSLFGNISPGGNNNETGGGGSLVLVLAPSTLGGLWAASSNSPSLLLDTKEEMILPHMTTSWNEGNGICSRRGTVVTLDPSRYLAMPPLYSPFQPVKRSGYSSSPSMAHVAAATLAIVLDVARTVDVSMNAGTTNDSVDVQQQHVVKEMKAMASSCASVLHLAADEARNDSENNNNDENTKLAQQHLLDAIPRLSPLMEQCSILSNSPAIITAGTIPQKLANALLPTYFPQYHLATYLACILPGLCDALSTGSTASDGKTSMVEEVANSIISCGSVDGNTTGSSLSSWASRVTMEAGIPSIASLAYGTPDLSTLVGSLDSYEALVSDLNGGVATGGGQDDHRFTEDVLQRSLSR